MISPESSAKMRPLREGMKWLTEQGELATEMSRFECGAVLCVCSRLLSKIARDSEARLEVRCSTSPHVPWIQWFLTKISLPRAYGVARGLSIRSHSDKPNQRRPGLGSTLPLKNFTYVQEAVGMNVRSAHYTTFMKSIAHQEIALGRPEFCV